MMNLTTPELLVAASLLINISTYFIYIRSIIRGNTRPHLYTWIVFSMLVVIGFLAQLHENAGVGTYVLGLCVGGNLTILGLSFKYGENHITTADKIALGLSLTATLPWLITSDPLGSVVLIAIVNVIGFFPTFRKCWDKPFSEKIFTYFLGSTPLIFSLMAMDVLNLTTALYPSVIILSNTIFAFYCYWRRTVISGKLAAQAN